MRFQKSGFKGIGENKALHALLKADGHISPVQLDHLANAELSVSHSASNGNAGNIDLRFFGLLGLCGSDRRFHAEGSSDKIRLSRWRPSWSGGLWAAPAPRPLPEHRLRQFPAHEPRAVPPDALFACLEKLGELADKASSPELDKEICMVLKQITAEFLLPEKG